MASDRWRDVGTGWLNKYKKHDPSRENSPFFKGTATVNGEEVLMTGWIKQGKYGTEDQSVFISFTVETSEGNQPNIVGNSNDKKTLEDLFQ